MPADAGALKFCFGHIPKAVLVKLAHEGALVQGRRAYRKPTTGRLHCFQMPSAALLGRQWTLNAKVKPPLFPPLSAGGGGDSPTDANNGSLPVAGSLFGSAVVAVAVVPPHKGWSAARSALHEKPPARRARFAEEEDASSSFAPAPWSPSVLDSTASPQRASRSGRRATIAARSRVCSTARSRGGTPDALSGCVRSQCSACPTPAGDTKLCVSATD